MVGVLRTRRGLAAAAAAVIGCILLLLFASAPHWRPLLNKDAAIRSSPGPETAATQTSVAPPVALKSASTTPDGSSAPASVPAQAPSGATAALEPASPPAQTKSNPSAATGPAAIAPTFDIVRIEPTGDSVIAARAAPSSEITLLDGSTAIAHATADANGQVALLPPPLKPGEHSLSLSVSTPGSDKILSSQAVVVSVPQQPKTAAMVAMIQPNAPATILSGPVAGTTGPAPQAAGAGESAETVAIRSVEVESMGSFLAAGKAAPGSQSRVYLNGSYVATVTADKFGKWELQIKRGMKPGRYAVRIDQIEPKSGQVTARAEVPFDYPRSVSSSLRKRLAALPDPSSKRAENQNAPVVSPVGRATSAKGGVAANVNADDAIPSADLGSVATNRPAPGMSGSTAQSGPVGTRVTSALGQNGGRIDPDPTNPSTARSKSAAAQDRAGNRGTVTSAEVSADRSTTTVTGATPTRPEPAGSVAGQGKMAGSFESGSVSDPVDGSRLSPARPESSSATGAAEPASVASPSGSALSASKSANKPSVASSGSAAEDGASKLGGVSVPAGTGGSSDQIPAARVGKVAELKSAGDSAGSRPSGSADAPRSGVRLDPGAAPPASRSTSGSPAPVIIGQGFSVEAQPVPGLGSGAPTQTDTASEPLTAVMASSAAAPSSPTVSSHTDAVMPTIVPELVTATVIRGDSLWRISRKMLGHGVRYTQIYAVNTRQIRDPKLIYPGQVFVMPQPGSM